MNILLSAVGRRAYLVEYFKQVVHPLGGKVYATNTHPDATGYLVADEARTVPPSADPSYCEEMLELCGKWRIKLLFSLHDWDAPVIARARQRFLEIGTVPVMGSGELLATCLDKYATVRALEAIGIQCPETVLSIEEALDRLSFPMIVKPRWGQGSLGLFRVNDREELAAAYALSSLQARRFAGVCPEIDATKPQIVIQECLPGPEYGCDIVNDLNGAYRRSFVKRKMAMRSGETDVAESVSFPEVESAAARIGAWSGHLGCMDSDWMLNAEGRPCLVELNPRFGGGYPFTHSAGANVPRACVEWAYGQDSDSWYREYRTGVRTFKEIALLSIEHA